MHALLFQSHLLAIAIIHIMVIAFVYLEYIQNSSSKSNQSCRQHPVDRLTQNYTLFRTGYTISFPRRRNLFHMQHKILISHLLPCSHRSCMSVYCFMFGFVLLLYMVPYFSLKPWKIMSKVIEVKSYNWKIIEGSVWPGLWKTLSFKTRLEICHLW